MKKTAAMICERDISQKNQATKKQAGILAVKIAEKCGMKQDVVGNPAVYLKY